MLFGETVEVWLPTVTGEDDFGNDIIEYGSVTGAATWGGISTRSWAELASCAWSDMLASWQDLLRDTWGKASASTWGAARATSGTGPIIVDGVLVNPSTTTYDRIEVGRPQGYERDLTLHMPRGFDMDLRGSLVTVRGKTYRIVGDPERYTDANLPPECHWNLVVQVVRYDI